MFTKKLESTENFFRKYEPVSDYRPRKNTIIALALALELNEDDSTSCLSPAATPCQTAIRVT